ncbi:MAG: hypothetical protein KJ732_04695, partial [Candidatus Margulisbacteria bacterium]|nr:hypothetical protein [Candidatus Margulisiibacteriota bacterium]
SLMDGINNVYSLGAQIQGLQSLKGTSPENPEAAKLVLQQNFNQMLDDLISSSDDNDDDEENFFDPFVSHNTTDQLASGLGIEQISPDGSIDEALLNSGLDINSSLNSNNDSYLKSLYQLQGNVLALQNL